MVDDFKRLDLSIRFSNIDTLERALKKVREDFKNGILNNVRDMDGFSYRSMFYMEDEIVNEVQRNFSHVDLLIKHGGRFEIINRNKCLVIPSKL